MANEDDDGEKSRSLHQQIAKKPKTQIIIGVPSYQEVIESSQTKSTPPSLFKPSQSFSQAFAFVKSSDVYSPPPSSSAASSSSQPPGASQVPNSSQPLQTDGASSSSTPVATGSLPSNTTQTRNAILVSHRQKGNPLLKHIRNVKWVFSDIIPDYVLGQSSCALYLRELQKNFKLSVVLCHVDVEDTVKPLLEVTKTALLHDCTLLCAWSMTECARYLETIKVYENKPADLIQGQMDTDYLSRLNHSLTSIRHVNKSDVVTLGSTFGSLAHIIDASMEDLARCPGIGERKVRRLYDTFHEPFKRATSSYPSVVEPTIPEAPVQKNVSSKEPVVEDEDFVEDSRKRKKKEPEKTVKTALSAVFARYSDKLSKKKEKQKEKDATTESDAEIHQD
ncbi:DNA excision repair protein ERCC-1 isoform X2 [Arabidopsis lyrata subsp. lyrata]|uniref:DNA excision repair protein ERCC-1 isoform X2 n=1 Tax=Arabidopsis lyrata subsp. lyrata TaxID=81972 RepID=UPI000A29B085|nr:DNA excision repair protein ERCC-1 isoform X2 [Arabidopsis lyrata subsp. lyrata]|eukprot:XP_020886933.1 DNA excision repair protein ERCC-1 isoform X2 [Arabidopsis lyrata subsp. lyrata]